MPEPSSTFPEIEELKQACLEIAADPPRLDGSPDDYVGQFAVALYVSLEASESIAQAALAEAIYARKKMGPFPGVYALNHILRDMQQKPLYDGDPNYPYDQHVDWLELTHSVLNDNERLKDLCFSVLAFRVGSDIARRIRGPKLAGAIFLPERMNNPEDPLRILNIGSARDHNLAALVDRQLQLDGISIASEETILGEGIALSPQAQLFLQRRVNELLAQEVSLGHSVGVDLWPIADTRWGNFIGACRYPSEATPEKWAEYQRLESTRNENSSIIRHVSADFATINSPPNIKNGWREHLDRNKADDRYDIAVFSTCLYLNDRSVRERMFDNALPLLRDGGIVVVQEFGHLRVSPTNYRHPLDQFEFISPNSEPNTYHTLVFDPTEPQRGLQPVVVWPDGRCNNFIPGAVLLDQAKSEAADNTESTT